MHGRRLALVVLLSVAAGMCSASMSDDAGGQFGPSHYVPPEGFGPYLWGDPLAKFRDFVPDPLYAQVAYGQGKTTLIAMECNGTGAVCDLTSSLRTMRQATVGEGFHALAEYYVQSQGVQLGDSGPIMYPVFYQFCAQWRGFSDELPSDIQLRMQLCGMRLLFRSQTAEEIAASDDPDRLVTNYDRILDTLIAAYGEPENYEKQGVVVIVAPDGRFIQPRLRRFDEWRWCSLRGDAKIAPDCKASVVLAFDSRTGWGVVLYATRPVWEFAYARHQGGADDDGIYRLLRGIQRPHSTDNACTGSNLCRPDAPLSMPEARKNQFRLRR